MAYTPPELYTGKEWYVGFYAHDPALGQMRRKKIKVNFIGKISERRTYSHDLIKRLSDKLRTGWNPWIEADHPKAYETFNAACDHYRALIDKLYSSGSIREETYTGYASYLKNLRNYNEEQPTPLYYIYQLDTHYVGCFLDHIWIDRGNSGQTRDNYLGWLRLFCNFLIEKQYLKANPCDPISSLGRKKGKKQRTIIPPTDLERLKDFCEKHSKHYLLACYILYYCFIRPKEMSHIQLKHISVAKGTLFIPENVSKNKKDGVVTIPDAVMKLMIELEVFSNPNEYYLFSDGFYPGANRRDEKQFRDYWGNTVRKKMKFPRQYKFYSLKDTGITELLRDNVDTLSVRDQARHHSLLMTDIYTPHDIQEANELIKKRKASF